MTMEQNFSNTAVFCANCGRKLEPEDKFCRECGSQQVRVVDIEPINVDKKMRLRAAELLPDIDRSVPYVAMASDGMPVRGVCWIPAIWPTPITSRRCSSPR